MKTKIFICIAISAIFAACKSNNEPSNADSKKSYNFSINATTFNDNTSVPSRGISGELENRDEDGFYYVFKFRTNDELLIIPHDVNKEVIEEEISTYKVTSDEQTTINFTKSFSEDVKYVSIEYNPTLGDTISLSQYYEREAIKNGTLSFLSDTTALIEENIAFTLNPRWAIFVVSPKYSFSGAGDSEAYYSGIDSIEVTQTLSGKTRTFKYRYNKSGTLSTIEEKGTGNTQTYYYPIIIYPTTGSSKCNLTVTTYFNSTSFKTDQGKVPSESIPTLTQSASNVSIDCSNAYYYRIAINRTFN